MKRFRYSTLCMTALLGLGLVGGCGEDGPGADLLGGAAFKEIAKQCGLACPGDMDNKGTVVLGVVEGNANISGVASVDSFFSAVVGFNTAAVSVSGGIDAQLEAIRADFGLAADADVAAALKAKLNASLEGGIDAGLKIEIDPAKCQVDAQATVDAQAKCDASVSGGEVSVKCEGTCEAEAGATLDCGAEVEVQCTLSGPEVACEGSCEGSCELTVAASCEGTCKGTCDGTCSAMDGEGNCAGSCDGMCMGSCETAASASCSGKCSGSCTAKAPEAGCSAEAKASCKAEANAKVECSGSCDGDFEPPMAKAECQASAKAEASVNVQCTPPEIKVEYTLATSLRADATASAEFETALRALIKLRLPALLQAVAKAKFVARAGEGLALAASDSVSASVKAALNGKLSGKALFGLNCAVGELPKVKTALTDSTEALSASLSASVAVATTLNI